MIHNTNIKVVDGFADNNVCFEAFFISQPKSYCRNLGGDDIWIKKDQQKAVGPLIWNKCLWRPESSLKSKV